MRLCSLSVDLDEIYHYGAIHGRPRNVLPNAVYDIALPRIAAFAARFSLPLTLFVVGADLSRTTVARQLKEMARAGHEIGNHSLDHLYDLTRRTVEEQRYQVVEAANRLESAIGIRPVGFRAPGYTVTDALLAVLEDSGVLYDSSVFPCPAYFGAKGLALLAIALRGQESHSIFGSPHVLRAPIQPYRVGKPYWRRGAGVLELPIQVATPARLPFIGTTISTAGARAATLLARSVVGDRFINLELHGIDFLDQSDGLQSLSTSQFDLRIPFARKLRALEAVVSELSGSGYEFVRLDAAARALG